jgi:hypothetical protein
MDIDRGNPVVALCAAGMECEGDPPAALRLFEQAWATRTDDYDAAIAAHYVARHQATPADTLHWNEVAVHHAERVPDERAANLMASLYLNLGDALAGVGRESEARAVAIRAEESLRTLPGGGYRDLVARGVRRLQERLVTLSESGGVKGS